MTNLLQRRRPVAAFRGIVNQAYVLRANATRHLQQTPVAFRRAQRSPLAQ